jgi:hypothetical protein
VLAAAATEAKVAMMATTLNCMLTVVVLILDID